MHRFASLRDSDSRRCVIDGDGNNYGDGAADSDAQFAGVRAANRSASAGTPAALFIAAHATIADAAGHSGSDDGLDHSGSLLGTSEATYAEGQLRSDDHGDIDSPGADPFGERQPNCELATGKSARSRAYRKTVRAVLVAFQEYGNQTSSA